MSLDMLTCCYLHLLLTQAFTCGHFLKPVSISGCSTVRVLECRNGFAFGCFYLLSLFAPFSVHVNRANKQALCATTTSAKFCGANLGCKVPKKKQKLSGLITTGSMSSDWPHEKAHFRVHRCAHFSVRYLRLHVPTPFKNMQKSLAKLFSQ